ncbi:uncharacterized protein LOC113276356 [Papaver somniferum]|uniref:uncharacterized protein LOC113276356 n=1 Tax=Papaver somniferum TaxID=3469 RepID=UPI000E7018A1|nr:uncharacterized protein LOC113276356 [Papaver somniferum]XP_026381732.1 uncharacterized protein LOC113276356 [Papaver somniferum]XP_026381733.1 uncharacterized protein LOC113276356 [Papaver somniferum]XP_026381734.1 uncharacterized protein LOC113276356 [Papaver somniferum]XP_026381735.1 uncharacterized protein LOC113276356 [Papaver somniferum]XP_026381736.1 uncharacterized protein LOC113276356 [Papaver somniferum]XP_026381737.1 uncharacterized protein LOC113276356 [Papaver somniferum]XP_0
MCIAWFGFMTGKLKICGLPEEQFCEQAFVRYTKQDLLYFHGVSVTRLSMAFCGTTRWEYRPRRNYARSNFSEPNVMGKAKVTSVMTMNKDQYAEIGHHNPQENKETNVFW